MRNILFLFSLTALWFLASYFTNWENSESKDSSYPQDIPIPIQMTMERSCYDCHTNHTRIPWYGKVFPVNIYLKNHVEEGRESMNLSEWDNLSPRKKATWAFNILEEVEEGNMPPSSYLWIHWGAILQEEELGSLKEWHETLERIYEEHREE